MLLYISLKRRIFNGKSWKHFYCFCYLFTNICVLANILLGYVILMLLSFLLFCCLRYKSRIFLKTSRNIIFIFSHLSSWNSMPHTKTSQILILRKSRNCRNSWKRRIFQNIYHLLWKMVSQGSKTVRIMSKRISLSTSSTWANQNGRDSGNTSSKLDASILRCEIVCNLCIYRRRHMDTFVPLCWARYDTTSSMYYDTFTLYCRTLLCHFNTSISRIYSGKRRDRLDPSMTFWIYPLLEVPN